MNRLITLLYFALAMNMFARPFSDLSFEAACQNAQQGDKIVFVDFFTTWCAPCRLLDIRTWPDPQVITLLEEKTVALRLDAEQQTNLAKRYKIEAYPTMLLLKPDGTELNRLVGFREPKTFLTDFKAALADPLPEVKQSATPIGTNDPMVRMKRGVKFAADGQESNALKEYLWCFDHGDETNPRFDGIRQSILLDHIKKLAGHYPDARTALEIRRDQRLANLSSMETNQQMAVECVRLNNVLNQQEKNFAVFDQIPVGSPVRWAISDLIVNQLLKAKRYADVLTGREAKSLFTKEAELTDYMTNTLNPEDRNHDLYKKSYRKTAVKYGTNLFEALAGLQRNAEAGELAQQILRYDSSATTLSALSEAATRAGNVQLVKNMLF